MTMYAYKDKYTYTLTLTCKYKQKYKYPPPGSSAHNGAATLSHCNFMTIFSVWAHLQCQQLHLLLGRTSQRIELLERKSIELGS